MLIIAHVVSLVTIEASAVRSKAEEGTLSTTRAGAADSEAASVRSAAILAAPPHGLRHVTPPRPPRRSVAARATRPVPLRCGHRVRPRRVSLPPDGPPPRYGHVRPPPPPPPNRGFATNKGGAFHVHTADSEPTWARRGLGLELTQTE